MTEYHIHDESCWDRGHWFLGDRLICGKREPMNARKEPLHFMVAEVAEGRYFTLQGHKSPRWHPELGTEYIHNAVTWGTFGNPMKVLRDIRMLCERHSKPVPRISRIVLVQAIITQELYTCESPTPSSSEPSPDQTRSSSTQIFQVEHTLSPELRTFVSTLQEALQKRTSKRTSQKSRSKK